MAITWSRLHEVRGLAPRPLTYEDLVAAVEDQTGEEDRLDWKAQLGTDDPAKREFARKELAKDAAAMANSGGGVLAFGASEIGEEPNKELVASLVELSEKKEQHIRSVISSRVRPFIAGIEIDQLPDPENPRRGFIVVSIPASPEAPHFCENRDDVPYAPWRNGSHTETMRESQIERAYRDRLIRREGTEALLTRTLESTICRLNFEEAWSRAWIVTVAVPTGLRQLNQADLSKQGLSDLYTRVENINDELFSPTLRGLIKYADFPLEPQLGLRKWVLRFPASGGQSAPTNTTTYAELHHDGVVVLARPVGWPQSGPSEELEVGAPQIEDACGTAVSLTKAWFERLHITGTAGILTALIREPRDERPVHIMGKSYTGTGKYERNHLAIPVLKPECVDTVMLAPFTTQSLCTTAKEIAEGILHQFNYATIELIRSPNNENQES